MASDTSASPKTASDSPNKGIFSKITWYELLAIPVVAVGVTIYWFREAIADAFWTAQEGIALWLGIGIAPLVLWLGALLAVLILKPSLFRHYRLWIASIPLVALAFGALALFKPMDGALHGSRSTAMYLWAAGSAKPSPAERSGSRRLGLARWR